MGRPDFIERRLDFTIARQRARRTHVQPCDCGYCITSERIETRMRETIARQRQGQSEAPF